MATGNSRILSIDIKSAATDHTHESRSPCSVAIVDDNCEVIFSSLIKPTEKVVSDLYPLTGVRINDLDQAPSFEEVLQKLYPLFDSTTIIVGQSPNGDIQRLKLEKDVHYASTIELNDWFKAYNNRFNAMNFFSLAHEAFTLLNIDLLNTKNGPLSTQDAKASMQLYLKYKDNEKGRKDAGRLLLNTPNRAAPARACNYKYEGVCLAKFYKKCVLVMH